MDKAALIKTIKRLARKAKRKARRLPKVAWRIGKRVGRKAKRKTKRRARKTFGFLRRLARSGPRRLTRRWFRRKTRRSRTRTMQSTKRFRNTSHGPPRARVGTGGRHDIVPMRTIVEWLTNPQLGRGRVLAFLPGETLDVEFEQGGRPPSGVPIREVRVLIS